MLTYYILKIGLKCWSWRLYKVKGPFSKAIYAYNRRKDPPGSNHAKPTPLSTHAGYNIMKLKDSWHMYVSLAVKELTCTLN